MGCVAVGMGPVGIFKTPYFFFFWPIVCTKNCDSVVLKYFPVTGIFLTSSLCSPPHLPNLAQCPPMHLLRSVKASSAAWSGLEVVPPRAECLLPSWAGVS